MTQKPDYDQLAILAGTTFTPGTPVNERDLFAGRLEQLNKVGDAVSQLGYHAVLYGERGVGKTSLANIISQLEMSGRELVPCKVTCDASDSYVTLWRKAFQEISVISVQTGFGFGSNDEAAPLSLEQQIEESVSPNDIRRLLTRLTKPVDLLIIFDEFDRINSLQVIGLMADTIKTLSDGAVRATVLIVGVADSVDSLIANHASIERALVQVPLPRMSSPEIKQILERGLARLSMTATRPALAEMIELSQGLPYITHLLGLHISRAALSAQQTEISADHVDIGIKKALDQWQQSIKNAYYSAVVSSQPGNIFREVLLACAMAETDELGYFSAANLRSPLLSITNRAYDIPSFANHLKEFSEPKRGSIIQRVGQTRRFRYRFVSPLMKPYVVMRGFSDGLIKRADLPK